MCYRVKNIIGKLTESNAMSFCYKSYWQMINVICNNPPRMAGLNREWLLVTASDHPTWMIQVGSTFVTVIPDVSLLTTYCHSLIYDYKWGVFYWILYKSLLELYSIRTVEFHEWSLLDFGNIEPLIADKNDW